jgi:hypothetical protein
VVPYMSKQHILNAEIYKCEKELRYLGSASNLPRGKNDLIISSGDISDVDGLYALAEYAKTGADVLFVMNYTAYLKSEDDWGSVPVVSDGKGFRYGVNTYYSESKSSLRKQVKGVTEDMGKYESYEKIIDGYVEQHGSLMGFKFALTDLAFEMITSVWRASGTDLKKGNIFMCVGGVNDINPFCASKLKNEIFVYNEIASAMKRLDECTGRYIRYEWNNRWRWHK